MRIISVAPDSQSAEWRSESPIVSFPAATRPEIRLFVLSVHSLIARRYIALFEYMTLKPDVRGNLGAYGELPAQGSSVDEDLDANDRRIYVYPHEFGCGDGLRTITPGQALDR